MSPLCAGIVLAALLVMTAVYARALRSWPRLLRLLATAVPLSQCLLLLFYVGLTFHDPFFVNALWAAVGLAVVCLVADGMALPLFQRAQRKELEEQRAEAAAVYAAAAERSARQLESEVREAAALRDQMAAQLREMAVLVEQTPAEEARRHLEAAEARVGGSRRFCAHAVADALLALKAEAADRAGVRFTVSAAIPDETGVADIDLCAVLSNLIDNGLRAAAGASGDARFVEVRAQCQGSMLAVEVDNGFAPEAASAGRRPRTQGPSRGVHDHGWGLEILRDIAERYHGTFESAADGSVWRASCLLVAEGAAPANT